MLEFLVFSFLDFLQCWQARRILEAPNWNDLNSKKRKITKRYWQREVSPQGIAIQITAQVGEEKGGYNFNGSWS